MFNKETSLISITGEQINLGDEIIVKLTDKWSLNPFKGYLYSVDDNYRFYVCLTKSIKGTALQEGDFVKVLIKQQNYKIYKRKEKITFPFDGKLYKTDQKTYSVIVGLMKSAIETKDPSAVLGAMALGESSGKIQEV